MVFHRRLCSKGYGNEGHDSANSEYADIAEREGGVEDFQELIKIAHDYNTEIGIHVNAQEAYPEAASFNEEMLQKPFSNGWGWLDQSQVIDKLWDLSSQARWKRFVQLYDRINGTDFYSRKWPDAVENSLGEVNATKEEIKKDAESREDSMDFIYLTYGIRMHGRQDRLRMRSILWDGDSLQSSVRRVNMTLHGSTGLQMPHMAGQHQKDITAILSVSSEMTREILRY